MSSVEPQDVKAATQEEKTPLTPLKEDQGGPPDIEKGAAVQNGAAKPDGGGGGTGIDIDKFLETSLRVRLPQMDQEGKFVVPPRQKKTKGANKKVKPLTDDIENQAKAGMKATMDKYKKQAEEHVATAKEQALLMKNDCLPEGMKLPSGPPTKEKMIAFGKKYAIDAGTNLIYAGVSFGLAMAGGSSASSASLRSLGAAHVAHDAAAHAKAAQHQAAAAAEQATAAVSDAQNKLLAYWVIIAGAMSGVMLVIKNIRWIVNTLFEILDKIEDKINEAIDKLQAELEEEVGDMLDDALEDAGDNPLAQAAGKAARSTIVGGMSRGIDDAQKSIDARAMLPYSCQGPRRLTVVLAAIPVFVVVVQCILNLVHALQEDTSASSSPSSRRLLNSTGIGSQIHDLIPMVRNLVTNAIVAWLSSTPVTRFLSNTVIRKIQTMTNAFILGKTKESMGGEEGIARMQSSIDMVTNPSGASKGLKDIRSCAACQNACAIS